MMQSQESLVDEDDQREDQLFVEDIPMPRRLDDELAEVLHIDGPELKEPICEFTTTNKSALCFPDLFCYGERCPLDPPLGDIPQKD